MPLFFRRTLFLLFWFQCTLHKSRRGKSYPRAFVLLENFIPCLRQTLSTDNSGVVDPDPVDPKLTGLNRTLLFIKESKKLQEKFNILLYSVDNIAFFKSPQKWSSAQIYRHSFRKNKPKTRSINSGTGRIGILKGDIRRRVFFTQSKPACK